MTRAIALLVFIAGISLLSGLWPTPAQRAADIRHDAIVKLAASVSSENPTAFEESTRRFYQSIVDSTDLEAEFWPQWIQTLVAIAFCVIAGVMMFRQFRGWAILIVASTAFYAWNTTFFYPIYFLFLKVDSIDHFVSRLEMFSRSPVSFAAIAWFNLIVPTVLSIATFIAIRALLQMFSKRGRINNAP